LKSGISRSAFIVFSSLLLVLSTLQPAFAADPTNIVATDAETDEVNSFTELDAAVDEFGNTWTFSNTWIKNYSKNEKPQDIDWKVMTTHHSNFGNLVDSEAVRAEVKLLILCSTCLKSFDDFAPYTTITYPERINKLDDPEIQKKMVFESDRAQKTMDALLDIHSSTTWHKE